MLVCLCCLGAPQHASIPVVACWHASMPVDGQRPARGQECLDVCGVCMSHRTGNKTPTARDGSVSKSLARWRWVAIDQHVSMSVCQHASMPACQHATTELLACRGAPQQHRQTSILHRLTTDQHASMPACHLPGCWYVCNARVHPSSTDMPTFFVLLPRWLAINQHASMPTTGGAGMLGCTLAAQTDQHSWPPFLTGWPSTSMPA